ncbi:MAG TPA: hypothetical protein VLM88_04405 [Proteiniclasticum sp.]|nr:hypothetical protein [Proteiniclasticum sp.]
MSKSTGLIRKGIFVTLTALIVMVVAFFVYFVLFMLFERTLQGNYAFVPKLRAGYGILWLLGAFLLDQTKFKEWLKAGIFAGGISIFMITMGVVFYENLTLEIVLILLTFVLSVIYLIYRKKELFYYYGVFIALSAAGFYLWN